MKRSTLVEKLIKEGMSEKTLVRFTDKQLLELSERMLGEGLTATMADISKSPALQAAAKDPKQNIRVVGEDEEVSEELKGNQKKLDKNHNDKIDGQDFKILKGQKKEVKKSSEVKEWVEKLVENKYHSFTSKNEIMELISVKLNESDTMVQHGPKVKKGHNGVPEFMSYDSIVDAAEPKTAPTTKPAPTKEPGTKPTPNKDPRKTPFRPGPGPNPKPKALKETKKSK
jgi:hypothetical protein